MTKPTARPRALGIRRGRIRTRPITIALDVDGTVVAEAYPEMGEDIGAVPWLRRIAARFPESRLMLWTCRGGDRAQDAAAWLKDRGVTVWAVNSHPEQSSWDGSPKAHADIYVDDRALGIPRLPTGSVDWDRAGPLLLERMAEVARQVRRMA